jgi:hypothetical protein
MEPFDFIGEFFKPAPETATFYKALDKAIEEEKREESESAAGGEAK